MVQEHIKLAHQAGNARPGHIAAVDGSDGNLAQVIGGNVYPFFLLKLVFPHQEANAERTGASPSKKRAVVVEGAESDSQAWSGHFLTVTPPSQKMSRKWQE